MFQKSLYSCGPVAIKNALIYKNLPVISEEKLIDLCNAKENIGTKNTQLFNISKQFFPDAFLAQSSSLEEMNKFLMTGKISLVNYFNPFSQNGHFSLITKKEGNRLFFIDSFLGNLSLPEDIFLKYWYSENKKYKNWAIYL